MYGGINDFRKVSQFITNLVKYEGGDVLADSHNTLNRWKNYFCQPLELRGINDVRQVEMHTAEPFVPERSPSEVEIITKSLKRQKSTGTYQIPAEVVRV